MLENEMAGRVVELLTGRNKEQRTIRVKVG